MHALPFTRRQLAVAAVAVVALLFVGARLVGHRAEASAPPIPTARSSLSPRSQPAAAVVVDVAGAVRRPGLYHLARGARVADALTRAGGATAKAELELVNLAALVSDGEQIVVPRRGAPVASVGGSMTGGGQGPVHLNSATIEQLDTLPGVGPVTAQKIVDYRTQHGAFSSLAALDAIPGIGPARLEQLKGLAVP